METVNDFVLRIPDGMMPLVSLIVIVIAVAWAVVQVYRAYQQGKVDLELVNTGVKTALDIVEDTPIDEFIERQYLREDTPDWLKNVIRTALAATNPENTLDASEARIRLYEFLRDTTDGDLNT